MGDGERGAKKNGDSLKWHFLAWGLGEESRLWNLFRKLLKQLVMFFLKNTHTQPILGCWLLFFSEL